MSATGHASLAGMFADRVASSPDVLAYDDGERALTYEELDRSTRELAAGLQAAGVEPGDRVALALGAGVAFCEVFWAAQRVGAVPCALNPSVPAETLARRVAGVRPRLVVGADDVAALRRPGAHPDEAAVGPDDLAHLQTTSGTSGEPRAAMVTQRNVLAYQAASHAAYGMSSADVLVSWVPPWHDLGLVHYVVRPVYSAIPCHIVEPAVRTIPRWFDTISRVGGTMTGAPDFALRMATRLVDPARVDLRSLRTLTNGGEPVRSSTIAAFEERFGVPGVVMPGYGLAEATLGVATRRLSEPVRVDDRGNVACGPAFPGLELRAGASADAPGEILVRGETVFAGYLDDPEGTAEVLRGGWLHTGDVGYLDEEARLYVLGRRRAVIKRGGALLSPRELEEAALGVDGVRVAAAVGVPVEAGTEAVVVVVETAEPDGAGARDVAAAVAAAVRGALGFAPERVVPVAPRAIPRTHNGKVRHARLGELLAAGTLG